MTSMRKGVVSVDLNGGSGGSRWCVPDHNVLVNEFLDESVRTVLPLRVKDGVFFLVELCMPMLRESKGASAEDG